MCRCLASLWVLSLLILVAVSSSVAGKGQQAVTGRIDVLNVPCPYLTMLLSVPSLPEGVLDVAPVPGFQSLLVTAESEEAIARLEERVKELDTPCELVNVVPLRHRNVETLILPREGAMVLGGERIQYNTILLPGLRNFWPDGVHQVLGLAGDNALIVRGEGMQALLQFAEVVKVLDQQLPLPGTTSLEHYCRYTPLLRYDDSLEAVRLIPLFNRQAPEVAALLNSTGSSQRQSVLFAQVKKCLAIGDRAVLVRAANRQVMNELVQAISALDISTRGNTPPLEQTDRKADAPARAHEQPALEVMLVKMEVKDANMLFGKLTGGSPDFVISGLPDSTSASDYPIYTFPLSRDAAQVRKALAPLITDGKAKVLRAYRLIVPEDDQVYFRFSDGWGDTPNLWLGNIRLSQNGGISCYADRITLNMDTSIALRLGISPEKTVVMDWPTEKPGQGRSTNPTITLLLITPYQMTPAPEGGMSKLAPLF